MIEIITDLCLFFYYIAEAIVLFFVPARFRSKDVKGQVVLITGAGSGMGRLTAHRFAKLGCRLVLWDINGQSIEAAASECREFGVQVNTYTCDISQRENVYSAAKKVKDDVGPVDILINNAGIVSGKKILECPDQLMQKTMEINSIAHFWTVKAFLPAMLERNCGHIVTVASGAGLFGVNGLVDYCASKFAAVGFHESLDFEMWREKKNVHTTVVCPYFVNTGMFDGASTKSPLLLPILEPEYVSDKIIEAILTNQTVLCLPKSVYFLLAVKNLLPVSALRVAAESLGLTSSMDSFKGRPKQS